MGRERGSATLIQMAPLRTVQSFPEAWFPSPGSLRSPPSPAEGEGSAARPSVPVDYSAATGIRARSISRNARRYSTGITFTNLVR